MKTASLLDSDYKILKKFGMESGKVTDDLLLQRCLELDREVRIKEDYLINIKAHDRTTLKIHVKVAKMALKEAKRMRDYFYASFKRCNKLSNSTEVIKVNNELSNIFTAREKHHTRYVDEVSCKMKKRRKQRRTDKSTKQTAVQLDQIKTIVEMEREGVVELSDYSSSSSSSEEEDEIQQRKLAANAARKNWQRAVGQDMPYPPTPPICSEIGSVRGGKEEEESFGERNKVFFNDKK